MSEQSVRLAIIAAQQVYGDPEHVWSIWATNWIAGIGSARDANTCVAVAEAVQAHLACIHETNPRARAAAEAAESAALAAAHWSETKITVHRATRKACMAVARETDPDSFWGLDVETVATVETLWEVVK